MLFSLLGILIGIVIGWFIPLTIPIEYTRYTAVVILGIADAIFGAVRAQLMKDHYDPWIFATGLFFNIVLAIVITLFGDILGLDLYLAATVVFTFRIFSNVGIARRALFDLYLQKSHYLKSEEIKR